MNIGELIICILVAAVLIMIVFVGGNAAILSANLSVVQSDVRSFEVSAEQMLLEHLELQTITDTTNVTDLLNRYLPETLEVTSGKTAKLDPWKTAYNVSYNTDARNGGNEFYISVVSAGKDKAFDATNLSKDDCGIIIRLKDGEVTNEMFGFKNSAYDRSGKKLAEINLDAA